MPPRKAKITQFRPVILIPPAEMNDLDRIAEKLMYALYDEVKETMQTERNAQVKIGLSEIGGECMRCLVRKISMEYAEVDGSGWKAQVGTFVHAGLEQHMGSKYTKEFWEDKLESVPPIADQAYIEVEERAKEFAQRLGAVDVVVHLEETVALREFPGFSSPHGDWPGFTLDGHCDLMLELIFADGARMCVVVDWKCLGPTTLGEKQAGKIGATYGTQLPAYGLGWTLRGYNVTHVALAAVPRDGELPESAFVLMRYDPQPVIDRLALIEAFISTAQLVGWERLIDSQPRPGHCFDCKRYEGAEDRNMFAAFR